MGNLTYLVQVTLICILLVSSSCKKEDKLEKPPIIEPPIIEESTPVIDYDGNVYKTVKIGNQIWMAENLKSLHYSDATSIESYAYNNDETNVNTYGRLYTWQVVMKGASGTYSNPSNVQGIAPTGWHVPSQGEWQQLINYLGGSSVAGGLLKETGETHWQSPNTGATNESLFCALPAGMFAFWQEYQWITLYCVFATSTDVSVTGHSAVAAIKIDYNNSIVTLGDFHPMDAVSVRCVKD
jgi:uncharacterized protein (TIGR02145 family)